MAIVYMATNKINGKQYVGQTIKRLQDRITGHICDARNKEGFKFQKALRKYGEESFEWKILIECDNKDLNDKEIYFIEKLDTVKNGYNVSYGGGGSYGIKSPSTSKRMKENNPMFNPEIAKKVVKTKKRRGTDSSGKTIEEFYNNIEKAERVRREASKRMKKNNPMFNPGSVRKANETKRLNNSYFKSHSEESKKKMSKSKSKNWIIIYPDGNEIQISNLLNFCKNNNLSCGHMSNVSSGKRIQHKGYRCRRC